MSAPSIPEDRPKDQQEDWTKNQLGRCRSKNLDLSENGVRSRDKVLTNSTLSLTELELLDMLLNPNNPCDDTKPVGKRL